MARANGVRVVGYYDCPGGGQVVVRRNVAYVGHVKPPNGTTIIDVSDPAKARELARISVPEGTLSHKVRVENDVMLVNREVFPIGRIDPDFKGGLEVFDVSNPAKPTRITTWASRGMHRFTFDGRYVYGSPELDGYLGNVVSIIDFQNPAKPQEVGRWWMPGQWTAGGEKPTWEGTAHRCHHPMRVGNRLYTSYWHALSSKHRWREPARQHRCRSKSVLIAATLESAGVFSHGVLRGTCWFQGATLSSYSMPPPKTFISSSTGSRSDATRRTTRRWKRAFTRAKTSTSPLPRATAPCRACAR